MDFIERMFGVSPDGGSGGFEILLFLIPVGIMSLLYIGHLGMARRRRLRANLTVNRKQALE